MELQNFWIFEIFNLYLDLNINFPRISWIAIPCMLSYNTLRCITKRYNYRMHFSFCSVSRCITRTPFHSKKLSWTRNTSFKSCKYSWQNKEIFLLFMKHSKHCLCIHLFVNINAPDCITLHFIIIIYSNSHIGKYLLV